jgi:ankyrin repeat protein
MKVCKLIMGNIKETKPKYVNGVIPFHLASFYGHIEVVRYIAENSTDKNPKGTFSCTPLHLAARGGHLDI